MRFHLPEIPKRKPVKELTKEETEALMINVKYCLGEVLMRFGVPYAILPFMGVRHAK
jgi:hypothetical protein